jgi:hypothetical protein
VRVFFEFVLDFDESFYVEHQEVIAVETLVMLAHFQDYAVRIAVEKHELVVDCVLLLGSYQPVFADIICTTQIVRIR